MMALEQQGEGSIDEAAFSSAKTVGDLTALARQPRAPIAEPFQFPKWNRSWWAGALRRINLPLWILPLARIFARVRGEGLDNLRDLEGPVLFASNHQSYFDAPSILIAMPAKWRYCVGIATRKEFFDAHFHPDKHGISAWFTKHFELHVLASLFFNIFPLPQREAGAKQALEYIGDLASNGWSTLIFPEGRMTDAGEIRAFQPGVGMMAARLHMKVVPVRITGLEQGAEPDRPLPYPRPCHRPLWACAYLRRRRLCGHRETGGRSGPGSVEATLQREPKQALPWPLHSTDLARAEFRIFGSATPLSGKSSPKRSRKPAGIALPPLTTTGTFGRVQARHVLRLREKLFESSRHGVDNHSSS